MLRNLFRRRLRTALTVLGVAVGILAFTVMGGMAEKFNRIIQGGEAYFLNRIAIRSTGGLVRLNLLFPNDIAIVRGTPGVKAVETHIMLPLDETAGFELAPRFLVGIETDQFHQLQQWAPPAATLHLKAGRWWAPKERGVAVLGAAIARKMRLDVGDTLRARDGRFRVVGVLKETLSLPDGWAIVDQADVRELMFEGSTMLKSLGLNEFYTNAYAVVDPAQGEAVTTEMALRLRKGFLLHSPQQLITAARQASTLLNTAILGAGAVAVLVGALAVINTMFVAVGERTREIGIKKAIGAKRLDILREFLIESTVIGLLGGALGIAMGAGLITLINGWTAGQGTPVFLLTPRLVTGAMAFAVLLGVTAGVIPAFRAASVDPVRALREM
ncbi:MAG TPA: FtsX-like permease family protein [Symbiobacteriaceae bacterium]|nr:FtsX-like permease family protein [Symbiobacteriaceae bacterium]